MKAQRREPVSNITPCSLKNASSTCISSEEAKKVKVQTNEM